MKQRTLLGICLILSIVLFTAVISFQYGLSSVPVAGPYYLDIPFGDASYYVGKFDTGNTFLVDVDTWQMVAVNSNSSYIFNLATGNLTDGGIVFVSNSLYTLTHPILISYESISIIGESHSVVIRGSSETLIQLTEDADRCKIENMLISGSSGSTYGISSRGVTGDGVNVNRLTVINCHIGTFGDEGEYGIFLSNFELCHFERNSFHNAPIMLVDNGYNCGNSEWSHNTFGTNQNNTVYFTVLTNSTGNIGKHDFHYNQFTNHQVGAYHTTAFWIRSEQLNYQINSFNFNNDRFEKISTILNCSTLNGGYIYGFKMSHINHLVQRNWNGQKAITFDANTSACEVMHVNTISYSNLTTGVFVEDLNAGTGVGIFGEAGTEANKIHDNLFDNYVADPIVPSNITVIFDNLGFITENAGATTSCYNGTWIAHGLVGDPNTKGSITLSLRGATEYNATFILRVPTILQTNATHFQIEFNAWETAGWTQVPVTVVEAQTVYWDATYKP